jgi:hypothetical protein
MQGNNNVSLDRTRERPVAMFYYDVSDIVFPAMSRQASKSVFILIQRNNLFTPGRHHNRGHADSATKVQNGIAVFDKRFDEVPVGTYGVVKFFACASVPTVTVTIFLFVLFVVNILLSFLCAPVPLCEVFFSASMRGLLFVLFVVNIL